MQHSLHEKNPSENNKKNANDETWEMMSIPPAESCTAILKNCRTSVLTKSCQCQAQTSLVITLQRTNSQYLQSSLKTKTEIFSLKMVKEESCILRSW